MKAFILNYMNSRLFASIIIAFVAFLVYSNSLENSFQFDDFHSIIENPYVRDIGNIPTYFTTPKMFSGREGSSYRPILLVTFSLNYWFGKYDVFGYHVVNIAIHVINSILIYFIISVLLGSEIKKDRDYSSLQPHSLFFSPALWGSILFAISPANTHTVNYISNRSELLLTLFYLSAFYCYAAARGRLFLYILSFLFYVCSVLTKENGATFPLIIFAYAFFSNKGFTVKSLIPQIPFWLINFFGYITLRKGMGLGSGIPFSWENFWHGGRLPRSIYSNILTQFEVMTLYIKQIVLPTNLSAFHDIPVATAIGDTSAMISLLFFGFLFTLAIYFRKKYWQVSFGIFWFVIIQLPTILIPLNLLINENRIYLPSLGYFLILSSILSEAESKVVSIKKVKILTCFLFLAVFAYGSGTFIRNQVWKERITLWEDAVKKYPNNALSLNTLGAAYRDAKKYDLAKEVLRKSIDIKPFFDQAHNNLGTVFHETGEYGLAIEEFKIALRLGKTGSSVTHNNLGNAYYHNNEFDKAVQEYKIALKILPLYEEAHYNLGLAYMGMGKTDEAIKEFLSAIKINPGYVSAYNNLGLAYGVKGERDKAIEAFEKAIVKDGTFPDPFNNIAVYLMEAGRDSEAKKYLDNVLTIAPDFPAALNTLGEYYLKAGKSEEAIIQFEKAIKIKESPVFVWNMALAAERMGRVEKAIMHWNRYLQINNSSDHEGNEAIRKHIAELISK